MSSDEPSFLILNETCGRCYGVIPDSRGRLRVRSRGKGWTPYFKICICEMRVFTGVEVVD